MVSIATIVALIVYATLIVKGAAGTLQITKLAQIFYASGLAILVLGLFITGFFGEKPNPRILLNIFTFLSWLCLIIPSFVDAFSDD